MCVARVYKEREREKEATTAESAKSTLYCSSLADSHSSFFQSVVARLSSSVIRKSNSRRIKFFFSPVRDYIVVVWIVIKVYHNL